MEGDGIFKAVRGRPNEYIKNVLDQGAKATLRVVDGGILRYSQSHFYMETQSTIATPDEEGGIDVQLSTQGVSVACDVLAEVLGIPINKVNVSCRRLGGAFGGKGGSKPSLIACMAASCAKILGESVRLVLPRDVDLKLCGGRQELNGHWQAAVHPQTGKIEGLRARLEFGQGFHQDMGKLHLHMFAAMSDMVYGVPNMECALEMMKTNAPGRTSVRSPAHFEASLLIETVMDGVAAAIGLSPNVVREANFFTGKGSEKFNLAGTMIPQFPLHDYSHLALWAKLKEKTEFAKRVKAVEAFNESSRWKKRGVAMTPARYGMFRSSGMKCRIQVSNDASITVHCAGTEMGQGLHTKVAQVISWKLKQLTGVEDVAVSLIRFANNSTIAQVSQPLTGGSTGSELSCFAAEDACVKLAAILTPFKTKTVTTWVDLVEASNKKKILNILPDPPCLEAAGYYKMPMSDLAYETFGVAMSEVEIDAITGESRILASHMMFDIGPSMSPAIDIGQMEGCFIMGVGQILTEGVVFDQKTGHNLTDNTWTYKPPICSDVPEEFTVELVDFEKERIDSTGAVMQNGMFKAMPTFLTGKTTQCDKHIRSAKATGEPPLLLSLSVHSALRNAIIAARSGTACKFEKGNANRERGTAEFVLPLPATAPIVAALCAADAKYVPDEYPHEFTEEAPETSSCAIA